MRNFRRAVWILLFLYFVSHDLVGQVDEWSDMLKVTSADHEMDDGSFALGPGISVFIHPDQKAYPKAVELKTWLAAHRGQSIRLTLQPTFERSVTHQRLTRQ